MMNLERIPLLGYIPAGSTNDFAASLGLPKVHAGGGRRALWRAAPIPSTSGASVKTRYFVYIAGFRSLHGSVLSDAPGQEELCWAISAYVLEGVKSLAGIKAQRICGWSGTTR